MDMSMTSSLIATTSTTMPISSTSPSMSMPSSTSMSMSMTSSSSLMGMRDMAMTFFTSTRTPLFSMTWIPTTTGQYAGTCIFLIVISAIFRAIIALRSYLESTTWSRSPLSFVPEAYKRYFKSAGDGECCAVETTGEQVKAVVQPWRVGVEGSRAILDVVIVGLGYLLMIAVMTMNVGYFMSVLGGTFVGSFFFARYAAARVCR